MKKTLALILTVVMIAASVPFAAFAGRFTDVADGKWYSEAISFCAANGYMDGVSEGVFDRSSNLSRSMFVTILAKIDGADLTAYEGRTLFTDVKVDRWYTAAITWAAENGYASGIGEGVFGYKGDTTREQIALFFYTYANLNGIDVTSQADLSTYEDKGRIHAWALDAVEWAVASGLISGTTATTLAPRGVCTRAEAAVMIRAFVLGFLTDCEHEWVSATCTEMGYCTKCGLKSGTELGHDKGTKDCTVTANCVRCGVSIQGTAHNAKAATCTTASVCSVCGIQVAPAKGHNYTVATCTAASKCLNCGSVSGSALGHTTSNGVCTRCGTEIFASAHNKLVYYLNTKGQQFEDYKGFVYQETLEDGVYTTAVALKPGSSTVYLSVYLEENTGLVYGFDMELPGVTWAYSLTHYGYANDNDYYTMTGGTNPGKYLDLTSYSFDGTSSSYKSLSESNAKYFLEYSLYVSDYLTQTYANGFSLSEYGFNSSYLYK